MGLHGRLSSSHIDSSPKINISHQLTVNGELASMLKNNYDLNTIESIS